MFFNFLESLLEEQNFKMNLLVLEVYGMIIDRLKAKMKPNIRAVVCALLKHACDTKVVVRIENYKVLEKLMLAVKPNLVITHLLDHLGDKKAVVRESILNMIMFGLLTFPSNEFDLKNIAATVVPTLVDPKRRVRHAALESVSILAAFLGPTKAVPLIRAIELLESHFEKGAGVLTAVQARLARRQLAKVTSEGLIEYALQVTLTKMGTKSQSYFRFLRLRVEGAALLVAREPSGGRMSTGFWQVRRQHWCLINVRPLKQVQS